jgi:Kef-type K+ transport system membrane component KefB
VVVRAARNIAIIALVALVITVLPGGGPTLDILLTIITIAFFAAIALLGYRLYREHHFTLDVLEPRQRLILYSSIGLAFLTFAATQRLFSQGGLGALAWLALLGLASYGVFWVFQQSRRYE